MCTLGVSLGRLLSEKSKPVPSTAIIAIIFSIFTVCAGHIHIAPASETALGQSIHGSWTEHVFSPFSPFDIVAILALGVVYGAALHFASLMAKRCSRFLIHEDVTFQISPYAMFACSAALIIIAWLPYLLAFYPGGLYSDTIGVIDQASGLAPATNQHTILYIFEWKVCLAVAGWFGKGKNAALFIMTLYQTAIMAGSMAYFVTWLHKKQFRQMLFMLFPLYPLNAISLWKDNLFSSFLFVFTLIYIDFCLDFERAFHPKALIAYFVFALLVAFSRNNGIYIVLASTLIMVLVVWRKRCGAVLFSLVSVIVFSATLIVQGPVYASMGLSGKFYENIGIPLQQVARTIVLEGDELNRDERDFYYNILPKKAWKASYRPLIVDSIKWNKQFNSSQIDDHKLDFFVNYAKLGLKHPERYLEAALMTSCGFWSPTVGNGINLCCYQASFWPTYKRDDAKQIDFIERIAGFPLRDKLAVPLFPSNAWFTWALLVSIAICLGVGNRRVALGLLPLAMLFVTLLVATPIAYSLRYCFVLVIAVPLFILAPWIKSREGDVNDDSHFIECKRETIA